MLESNQTGDLVGALAEEFLKRQRRGDQPCLEEYLSKYAEFAESIRERLTRMAAGKTSEPEIKLDTLPTIVGVSTPQGMIAKLGDFRILREVGRGGMGIVYEAVQESLGRRVALKVLPPHALLDPQMATRFQREAHAVARLHHTNIVQVYGAGEFQNLNYYVMQFVQGRGLDRVLTELTAVRTVPKTAAGGRERKGSTSAAAAQAILLGRSPSEVPGPDSLQTLAANDPWDSPTQPYIDHKGLASRGTVRSEAAGFSDAGPQYWHGVARIGLQVAEALAHAHAQGILHRDIKPSNLLLDVHGRVWVTDFGLAKLISDQDDLTRAGDVVGTVRYLPPERFQGQSDARGDIYSLGLTLYELLTLTPAFTSIDRSQLLEQVMHGEPSRPRQADPTIPRDLETLVLKAIARDPTRRYQTAKELAEDLKRFLDDRPIRARRTRLPERLWRWCRRNPGIATLAAIIFMLLVTVALGSTLAALRIAAARDDEEQQRRRAEDNAYKSHRGLVQLQITMGLQFMDSGDLFGALAWFTRALELDEGQPAEEMHRIRLTAVLRQCPRLAQMWFHGGPTFSVEFSPDGRRLVTSSEDGTAGVWDLASGAAVTPPLRHESMVSHATFSPDGKSILTTSRDGSARVWNAATGQPVTGPLKHAGMVWLGCYSRDSRLVATVSEDKTARIWEAAGGRPVTGPLAHDESVNCAAFSWDSRWLATASDDRTSKIWEIATGRLLLPPLQHTAAVEWAEFSPDGRCLVTIAGDRIYLWDPRTGKALFPAKRLYGWARRFDFHPDGRRVVVGGGDTAQILDVTTGEFLTTQAQHATGIWFIRFSPDGRRFATVGGNASRIWDTATGEPLTPLLKHHGLANHAAFSPDGRLVATTGGNTANVWDTRTLGPSVLELKQRQEVRRPIFSADGRYLANCEHGTLAIWDLRSGDFLAPPRQQQGSFRNAGFSNDGRWLLTTQADQLASVWDLADWQRLFTLPRQESQPRWIGLSPDNKLAVLGYDDKTVRVLDLATGEPKGATMRHPDHIISTAFSPDGRSVLTGCADWTARVWDWRTGRQLGRSVKHGGPLLHAEFSPDGRRVITGSHDRTARIWDAATGDGVTPPLVHPSQVGHATFSPDGRFVVTAAWNATVRVWEAPTGLPLNMPLKHPADVKAALFSLDSRRVTTVTIDGRVWRWDLGLTPDNRPTAQLQRLAQLLGGHQLDEVGGFVPVETDTLRDLWQQLRDR